MTIEEKKAKAVKAATTYVDTGRLDVEPFAVLGLDNDAVKSLARGETPSLPVSTVRARHVLTTFGCCGFVEQGITTHPVPDILADQPHPATAGARDFPEVSATDLLRSLDFEVED